MMKLEGRMNSLLMLCRDNLFEFYEDWQSNTRFWYSNQGFVT